MSYRYSDLLKTVLKIKEIIASHPDSEVDDALTAIADTIECSPVCDLAEKIKKGFEKLYYPAYPGTQLEALDVVLGNSAKSAPLKYLAAARLFSSLSGLLLPDEADPQILAICELYPDDDGDDHSQPKPRPAWIIEWGLRRRRQHVPK